jgi:hypothetical protein
MWKSVIYKEWLKIRWFLIGFTVIGLLGTGYLFLVVMRGFTFSGGKNVWYNFLFMGYQYFGYLKYIPLVGGLLIAIAQYFPETINKRIKLSFHLPIKENKILLMMHAFGFGSLLTAYLLIFAVFVSFSVTFFPSQIVYDAIISVFPWFLAGITAYFLVALIVLEPVWMYRFFYTIVGGFVITMYIKSSVAAAYAPANPGLLILTMLLSIALLFSAYRFRKGEM